MQGKLEKLKMKTVLAGLCAAAIMFGFTSTGLAAEVTEAKTPEAAAAKHGDMGAVGAKLAIRSLTSGH